MLLQQGMPSIPSDGGSRLDDQAGGSLSSSTHAFTTLLKKRGGCVVLDGGMGTGLGRVGLSPKQCWTASRNLDNASVRESVLAVHLQFLTAGADILTANTYNVSAARELRLCEIAGIACTPKQAVAAEEQNIRANIALAREAIAAFDVRNEDAGTPCPWDGVLAAAMGCFGSSIVGRGSTANRLQSSEKVALRVRGYGVLPAELEAFHRSRAAIAIAAGADALTFETIPDVLEAHAIAAVLDELRRTTSPYIEAIVTFTCRDAQNVDNGDPFEEAVAALAKCAACV